MAEAAFSEDGKYYSTISADGRLKIWDTETNILKQEYTPDLHLAAPPTCLQWITVAQSAGQTPKQGKNRASVSETESQCIALGTTNGKVLVYSVAQAKIQVVLQLGKKNKVSAVDWHRKYGLYSCCGKENLVSEWDLQTASVRCSYNVSVDSKSKQGNFISAIKIIPHNLETSARYLVTASWQVRLWRLNAGEVTVIKTLGHNASQSAVLTVATLHDHSWLIEGSQNERLLSFWDVTISEDLQPLTNGDPTPTKKKRKKSISEQRKSLTEVPTITNASYNFVLEDAPRTVDVDLKDEDGAVRLNLVAATRSGVVHYYGVMLNGSSIKPIKPSVTVQATTAEASPILLQCCRLQPTGELLLGYSNGPLMTFENVTPDLKTKTQVLIRGDTKTKKTKLNVNNEVNKVRSDAYSDSAAVLEPLGGVTRKRLAPGAKVEVPMEARLANLSLDIKDRSKGAVNENLTKLLMQGLHSKDNSILNIVLYKNDVNVARRTVRALPAECVPLLLERLVEMATMNTASCSAVCTWLNAVTLHHGALLLAMCAPHVDQLTRLLAIFTHRRSHLCQLLNLRGRLELTIKQRDAPQETKEQEAVLDYNDDSTSEEEMQIEKYKSESEESWGDENEHPDSERGDDIPDEEMLDGSSSESDEE